MGDLIEEAKAGNVNGVRRELDAGANIDMMSGHDTALTWSAYLGNTEVVRLLIERGADLSITNSGGSTPLKLARDNNRTEAAALLELAAQKPTESWRKMGDNSVAHIGFYPEVGQKLTTIFNFKSRDRIVIAENLTRVAQGVSAATSFDSLPAEVLEEALVQFTAKGGVADKNYVLNGTSALDKPKLKMADG